jgi:hypothetical protein
MSILNLSATLNFLDLFSGCGDSSFLLLDAAGGAAKGLPRALLLAFVESAITARGVKAMPTLIVRGDSGAAVSGWENIDCSLSIRAVAFVASRLRRVAMELSSRRADLGVVPWDPSLLLVTESLTSRAPSMPIMPMSMAVRFFRVPSAARRGVAGGWYFELLAADSGPVSSPIADDMPDIGAAVIGGEITLGPASLSGCGGLTDTGPGRRTPEAALMSGGGGIIAGAG